MGSVVFFPVSVDSGHARVRPQWFFLGFYWIQPVFHLFLFGFSQVFICFLLVFSRFSLAAVLLSAFFLSEPVLVPSGAFWACSGAFWHAAEPVQMRLNLPNPVLRGMRLVLRGLRVISCCLNLVGTSSDAFAWG